MSNVESLTEVSEEQIEELSAELSEDMEVMGPGQILAEARVKMGFTQEEVADKLNFRNTLVNNIENEVFDTKLPETFNRGYLRNYAKLVNVSQDDILASYEQLNVAKTQASELQSFSKGNEKLVENNRIMWVSYLILAILIAASAVWWMQNTTWNLDESQPIQGVEKIGAVQSDTQQEQQPETVVELSENAIAPITADSTVTETNTEQQAELSDESRLENKSNDTTFENETQGNEVTNNEAITTDLTADLAVTDKPEVILTNVTFTFSGDCWVNISDASGERIAWGVKKLGYIMKISGQAPFNVTLGKPELVAINFENENIDMTQFNAGNIAKFTLPIAD